MFNAINKAITYFKVGKAMVEFNALLLLFKRFDPVFKNKSLKEYRAFILTLSRDKEKYKLYKETLLRNML